MTAQLSDDDEDKPLVTNNQRLGTVTNVVDDTVYVDPDWNEVPEDILEELGWDRSDDQYKVPASGIRTVTDEEVILRGDVP